MYHTPIPFLILTGYLGAGKTTVLNRLLSARRERRLAVLVNELGRIHIDRQLVLGGVDDAGRPTGDLLELSDGCICCRVDLQRDLWESLVDIVARSQPEQLVLETTGIAEPGALLEGLARLPATFPYRLAPSVVCVVDAAAALGQLDVRSEVRAQILAADRLLLSKLDLASPDELAELHRRLALVNPGAERASFPRGEAPDRALASWLLTPTPAGAAGPSGDGGGLDRTMEAAVAGHEHGECGRGHGPPHAHGQLVAAAFSDATAPLLREPLWALLELLGERLVRAKGFAWVHGEAERLFVEKAGGRLAMTPAGAWGAAAPKTELVLIGEALDDMALQRQLWACRSRSGA